MSQWKNQANVHNIHTANLVQTYAGPTFAASVIVSPLWTLLSNLIIEFNYHFYTDNP